MLRAMSADRDGTVAVVGLGKIGLPLAAQCAGKGFTVIGCDVLPEVVDTVNAGRSHIKEEPGLEERIAAAVRGGHLRATMDTAAAVKEAGTIVLVVPLIVDGDHNVDYTHLDAATEDVARGLQRGSLVIIETTLPVGTTRNRVGAMLEKGSGLKAGSDFYVAFSPERVYAGRAFEDLRRYPKIVGGLDERSTERAVAFYREALDAEVWPVENAETAEFTKLAETTYRDVNIALANQLALYGAQRSVNVREAFKAANSQPYSHLHAAGIGVGGHCIPVYPWFLLAGTTDGELELARISRATNDAMVDRALESLSAALGGLEGKRVLVLGASYRADVKELAFSTAIPLVARLRRSGATVLVHDPLFTPHELSSLGAEVVQLETLPAADAVVVQAYHRQYHDLAWWLIEGLKVIFDGRGALDPEAVRAAGLVYLAVEVPATGSPK
jgi:nucleotide sugar dehydrogenase